MNKYKLSNNLILHKLKNKNLIVSLENSEVYTLNEMATEVLGHLKKGLSTENIKNRIKDRYDVAEGELEIDLERLFKILEKKKIILKV